jgi:menaquinone-specific isochorismate synthase
MTATSSPLTSSSLKVARLGCAEDLAILLAECCGEFMQHRSPRLISVAFNIGDIDLLSTLQRFSSQYANHFYFDHDGQGLLGIGKAVQFNVESRDRFAQTRDLIRDLSTQIRAFKHSAVRHSRSRFFCNFSFSESPQHQTPTTSPATILLPRWQIERSNSQTEAVIHLVLHPDFMPAIEAEKVWQELTQLRHPHDAAKLATPTPPATQTVGRPEAEFQDSVRQALRCIADGQLDKIVLARTLDVTASQSFNLVGSLRNLRDRYPNCYIFSATCGLDQTFIGASPERLVAVDRGQLRTEALAGSAPRGKTAIEDQQFANQLLNSDKEAREHQLVINFITQRLSGLGIQAELATPRLLQLANIQHRQTPIAAQIPADIHLLDAVAALHPTPAVAGLPREIACQHIQHHEPFDRGLYAAPIGWVDTQGNGEFAVGIRSAVLKGNQARLFAGAGIVAGSDPERELNEVQMKLQALLQALV